MAQILVTLVSPAFADDAAEIVQHLQPNAELAAEVGNRLGFALGGARGERAHLRRELAQLAGFQPSDRRHRGQHLALRAAA